MIQKRKNILLVIAIFLISAVCYFVYEYYRINLILSSTVPRKPKNTINETHQIDWWTYNQENLVIDSFKVKLLDGKMNLFNNQLLIAISIYGRLQTDGKRKFYIEKFHVCERPIFRDSIQNFDAEIQITPIIKQKKEEAKDMLASREFAVVHERIITSMHFGENKFLFRCGRFTDSLKVFQNK